MDTKTGLSFKQIKALHKKYGFNILQEETGRGQTVLAFIARFKNPLVIVLLIAATLSLFFGDKPSFYIIITIIFLSVVLDFTNMYRSQKAAEALKDKVRVKVDVIRDGTSTQVNVDDLVPGDIVVLVAGKIIPADGEIIEGKDLFINESVLTGESFPQGKPVGEQVYMGSGVISGEGYMRVTKIGANTKFAHIAKALQSTKLMTEFEREIKDFSVLIVKITVLLVIFVFLVNVLFHRDLLQSMLFSLALAVGLTPELLPLIITLNLTKGSLKMAKQGVIVKQLSAVQNFGSMDVLCTDKTGTLTEDKISLVKYVDGYGQESKETLELGYISSIFSTSLGNPLDTAIKNFEQVDIKGYEKIDEIPFDFERKRDAVVVHHHNQKRRFLIVKGAPEEVLKISTSYQSTEHRLTDELNSQILDTYYQLSKDGYRVLAMATKNIGLEKRYEPKDEKNLSFVGFLAFLDPAKESVKNTLNFMHDMGIHIKIITGDNVYVTEKIARDVNMPIKGVKTGEQLARMTNEELIRAVEDCNIFARVNPEQKMQIIQTLQKNGHVVGYMGDGINDAPSLRAADVSVSVNNAVDVAKDAADFILLRKSLHELFNGIAEGRKTFSNTMKYLRMSLSSNFGNMFSMAGASLFLPFLPMRATQILLNNLLYDSSQFAIPLDKVDAVDIKMPHVLRINELKRFMWSYGLLSSVFDFITFGTLLLIFHAHETTFQAGWFLESILTQILVVYVIRTSLVPFKQSKPAKVLIFSTLTVLAVAFAIVLLPLHSWFHFGNLTGLQIASFISIVAVYLVFAEKLKRKFYPSR